MEYALALLVLAAIVAAVLWLPLRRRGVEERREETMLAELSAAKEAKYREIRDAELDHRMGKLSGRTGARWTATCAGRRSRSCASSTGSRDVRPTAVWTASLRLRWKRFSAASRSSSRSS